MRLETLKELKEYAEKIGDKSNKTLLYHNICSEIKKLEGNEKTEVAF